MGPEVITAPPVVGAGVETPSIETPPQAQAPAEPQSTDVAPEVERNGNSPQAPNAQRVQPSSYYRERERVRRLEEAYKAQSQRMEEMANLLREIKNPKPDVSAIQKITAEELLNDPERVLSSREERLIKEFNSLKEEISQLKNQGAQAESMKVEREALEMLFPKSSPDADEPLEERLDNPERRELLEKVLKANPSLDRLMRIDPKGAAEFVLDKLNKSKPQTSPNVIPKSLMGSTVRGNPSGGSKQGLTLEDKMSELKKLSAEVEKDPALRFDAKHKERREKLRSEIDGLMREKRG